MLEAVLFDLDDTLANTKALESIRTTRNYDALNSELLGSIKPYKKVNDLLLALKNSGIKIGVVTNSGRRYADAVLKQLGLPDFDTVITYTDVTGAGAKPSPAGILQALDNLGLKPSQKTLYIGDSYIDFVAAYRAGVKPVACSWASRSPISQVPAVEVSTEFLLSELTNSEGLLPAAELCELHKGLSYEKKRLYFIPLDLDGNTITVKSDLRVICLGRYFSQKSVATAKYHDQHPLSKKIFEKESNLSFDAPAHWVELVSHCLEKTHEYFDFAQNFDIATVIPAKPGKHPRLERMLESATQGVSPPPEVITDLFYFSADAPSQKTLTRFERGNSIKNHLFINQKYNGSLVGRSVIVIDDVLTTGSTMRHAFELLYAQGASLVVGLALAKTVSIVEDEKECQKCGRPLKLRTNNSNGIRFWGCSGFQTSECDYTEQIEEKKCNKCGRSMVKRMNKREKTYFLACVGYNESPACNNTENL